MYYVTPAEGELFKKFSPELQKHNLEKRAQRQADYEDFVGKLKEYSKSDKPIWEAAEEARLKAKAEILRRQAEEESEQERLREEIRREAMAGAGGIRGGGR